MTRINVVPPHELTREHLVAEYKELPRVIKLSIAAFKRGDMEVPKAYTLGTGHVRFFYDKLFWCYKRYFALINEMKDRDYKPDPKNYRPIMQAFVDAPSELYNDWRPTGKDLIINRERIKERLNGVKHRETISG